MACKESEQPHKVAEEEKMKELMGEWQRRDGASRDWTMPRLLDMVLKGPNTFYAEMVKDSASFADFLEALEPTCFTNWIDTAVSHLETKRVEAVKTLESQSVQPQYEYMHQCLIDTLRAIRVSHLF